MRLLNPLPIPKDIWRDLSMDFIEGLPKSKGFSTILVVVDRLTKYAHFIPVKHPYTATTIAQLFMDCPILWSLIETLFLSVTFGRPYSLHIRLI